MYTYLFSVGQIYHVYNRGVEKRVIFLSDRDYRRFVDDLFVFNDEASITNLGYNLVSAGKLQIQSVEAKKKRPLVDILVFTLMPNHFHLILRQRKDNGIIKFMQKLGTGYTMYFNKRYERVGGLFQGAYKAVLINKQAHFIHLPYYIHTNPLELTPYRGRTSIGAEEAMKFLENYRWSSFLDYIGKRNFPHVISRKFLLKFFGGPAKYKKDILDWLNEKDRSLELIRSFTLE